MTIEESEHKKIFTLTFGNLLFDCIIALDGDLPMKKVIQSMGDIPILAADGAAISLLKKNIKADYVIGDLDTFRASPLRSFFEEEKIIYLPSQEENDFEKTLNFANSMNYKNLLIIGFHGGELEHTLNNCSVLKKYAGSLNLCVYDKKRYGIPIHFSIALNTKINEIISIIPQPSVRLTTKNLKWNLNNEVLELGIREGARNLALSDTIDIALHNGEYLLFIEDRLPYAPEFI
jgi:thiamine pyrophosphokinase